MKKIIPYFLVFFLSVTVSGFAQAETGSASAIPDKHTVKGRRELRKDKRIKKHTEKSLSGNAENLQEKSDKPFHKKKHVKKFKSKKSEDKESKNRDLITRKD